MTAFNNFSFEEDMTSCPIVFLHVPKTGGTSFIELLNSMYSNVVRGRDNADIGKKLTTKEGVPFPEVICGHFTLSASFYKSRIPRYAHVTLIRDPVDRVLSQIYYLKNSPEHPFYNEIKDLTVSQIYNSPDSLDIRYGVSDLQVHLLSGAAFASFLSKKGLKIQRAISNLQTRFSFFGLSERLEDFVKLCYKKFGWDYMPEVPHVNGSPKNRDELILSSPQELDLIKQHNRHEMQWYDWATQLYKERYGIILVDMGRSLTRELEIPEAEIITEVEETVKVSWWKRFKRRLRRALSWRSDETDN
jgi:hypothetical protein